MLLCRIGAKPVAHLMQYHLLQWEVANIKQLMTSNMTLTVLNLHQKTLKGATTKYHKVHNQPQCEGHLCCIITSVYLLRYILALATSKGYLIYCLH